jgi:hypothetical protein
VSDVHSFGLPAKPLKDKQPLSAFGGAQDRVAVGPMSPTIQLASSNLHLASQRPKVQIGAAGFGARLAQWPRDRPGARPPEGTNAAEVWQRPALQWKSRSPPAPSTHAVADIAHQDARCLTWSEAVLSGVPNGIRTRAAALKGRSPRPLDDGDPISTATIA